MTRLWLVLACVGFCLILLLAMWWGWRNRLARQSSLADLPALPGNLGTAGLPELAGEYIGTTFASSWQERVVHAGLGLPAQGSLTWYSAGVVVERDGVESIFIPAAAVVEARLAPGLAGRVVGAGGLLVVRWRLGEVELDSGFRADDKSAYPQWVRAINTKVTAA